MKKTLPAALFAAFCLLLCFTLRVGFHIAGPSEAGANELLSAAPSLKNRDESLNTEFLSDTSAYFNDHFFLRQELITAHNALNRFLFGVSPESSVIAGENGWLYYADSLDDYTGTAPMSETELSAIASNLFLMEEYCESQGAQFLFAVAPNKNSLYSENMPSYGVTSETHDAQRLFSLLDESSVRYLDFFRLFSQEEETLYFTHDSHWNARGAALAADSINAAFGRESAYYADAFAASQAHSGDLFEMLYPAATDKETDPVYGAPLTYMPENESVRPDSITIKTTSGKSDSLLAFRDSFGNNLYPYLADSFGSALFSRSTSYDLSQIAELGANCVLVELVERNLDYLLRYVPVMPAPLRGEAPTLSPSGSITLKADPAAKSPADCVLVKGSISTAVDSVYIISEGKAYEAFLLTDCGFAAHIPAESQPESICILSGDTVLSYTVE